MKYKQYILSTIILSTIIFTACNTDSDTKTLKPNYELSSFSSTDKEYRAYCKYNNKNIVEFLVAFQNFETYGLDNIAFVKWRSVEDNITGNTTVKTYADGSFGLDGEIISGKSLDRASFAIFDGELSIGLFYDVNGDEKTLCRYKY